MRNRELVRLAVVAVVLALTLAPAFAGTNPGDLVDPTLGPRGERDDTTTLAVPVFPSLRVIFDRFPIRFDLMLLRPETSGRASDAIRRGTATPRWNYNPSERFARRDLSRPYTTPSRNRD